MLKLGGPKVVLASLAGSESQTLSAVACSALWDVLSRGAYNVNIQRLSPSEGGKGEGLWHDG